MFIRRGGGDYDHLARIKEWSLTGGPDDDDGERRMTIPARTDRAAEARRPIPATSAWVSANAGAGKTHVLAQRVIRLLLDGVDPGESSLPHLHQGGGRQHGEPRVHDAGALDHA